MLPTFVIGLREGLEAVLIVSIVATFLRTKRASLRGLWVGVSAGVLLSIAVGVALKLVEQELPERGQEGMETVIGGIAVVFVTAMIVWMRTHARTMKKDLESAAAAALRDGTTTALALMAFLAVLREGFETSVFLLATFQSAGNAPSAMMGALLGLVAAVGLGWVIYVGGVRINMQRFFKVTGVFLVLVAAGLVLTAFRTAHEAGWVTVGQGRTVDLTWLTPAGSVRSALITGVLGIPSDPRVIEVLAWATYLLPMLAVMFWPARLRPGTSLARRLRLAAAVVMAGGAVALFALVSGPAADVPTRAPVTGGGDALVAVHGDRATLTVAGRTATLGRRAATGAEGADTRWTGPGVAVALPADLDLRTLTTYTDGRIPVGLDAANAPGPYAARWTDHTELTVLTRDGGLVDARQQGNRILTISGGGLASPRTFTVDTGGWQVDPAYAAATTARIAAADTVAHDRTLWKHWVPIALLSAAAVLLLQAYRRPTPGRDVRVSADHNPAATTAQAPAPEGTITHADSLA